MKRTHIGVIIGTAENLVKQKRICIVSFIQPNSVDISFVPLLSCNVSTTFTDQIS